MPPYNPIVPEFKAIHTSSIRRLGRKLAKSLYTISFADNGPKFQAFVSAVKDQVLKQVPLEATLKELLIKQHWTKVSSAIKANIISILLVMYPELGLFINHWIVKTIAILVINAKNRNDRSHGKQIKASPTQMIAAGLTPAQLHLNSHANTPTYPKSSNTPNTDSSTSSSSQRPSSASSSKSSTPGFDLLAHTLAIENRANQRRAELKERLEFQAIQAEKVTAAFNTPAERQKRLKKDLLGVGRHLGSVEDSSDDDGSNEGAAPTKTPLFCHGTNCRYIRDVPIGKSFRKLCKRCFDKENKMGTKKSSKSKEPPIDTDIVLPSLPTTKSGRARVPTTKKRHNSVVQDIFALEKEGSRAKKQKRAENTMTSTQACREIDYIVGNSGRTEELRQLRILKSQEAQARKGGRGNIKGKGKGKEDIEPISSSDGEESEGSLDDEE